MSSKTGTELFIVDNSDTDWKVIHYLHDWCQLAKGLDIATGYFEIGSLLSLKEEWKKVDHIRILMGDEVSKRTKATLEKGVHEIRQNIQTRLDSSIELEKLQNDFLAGVPAIVEAIKSGKIQCRVYKKGKFHAKAYITHARLEVVGSVALVGSSNFTLPGLTENIELNVQITGRPVTVLQDWYEQHWNDAVDVTPEVLKVFERHVRDYTPFEVYAKALQEFFRNHEMTATEWEQTHSQMYQKLDHYQKEGYHSLMKIATRNKGAFLCDGVGLGKTFVGLMLIERLVMRDKKRVMLLVPKSGRVAVWESHIKRYLPHLLNGFLPFKIYNHTDLMRGVSTDERDFSAEFAQMKEQADVVLIDEAHHFRNRGLANTDDDTIRSRYWKLYDIAEGKTVFLLTATPVNNALTDLQHQIELFSRVENPTAFASSVGIHNLPAHFQHLEKTLKAIASGLGMGELFEASQVEAEKLLLDDKLFRELVVQRSRAYAQKSQKQQGSSQAIFPKRADPIVASYSVKKTYGHLLGKVEAAFSKPEQLFSLAVYYPLAKWKGDPTTLDKFDENRQRQVVRLIRIQFLKRFESSIFAFESSCQTLLLKLLAFMRKNATEPTEVKRFQRWKAQNSELLDHVEARRAELEEESESEENSSSELGDEYLDQFDVLNRDNYRVEEIFDETYADMEQIVDFLEELKSLDASHDNKLQSLIKLLKSDSVLKKHKVIIFSEFMTTARYLKRELIKAGITGVEELDSASGIDRVTAIRRFSPYYNDATSDALAEDGHQEIRVLISTDVLSEGLNLQDATRLINYDLHWNPVRLMQRIGRVDRRLNPAIEEKIVADHPDQATLRRQVAYWNFLPPGELDTLLRLYQKVSNKTLRISKVFGIEGKKLLRPDDDFEALKDFNHAYEGEATAPETMHLEFQQILKDHPDLEGQLKTMPLRVFSGKQHTTPGTRAVFFCYALPAAAANDRDTAAQDAQVWTEEAGRTQWYLYSLNTEKIIEESSDIVGLIRSKPDTVRQRNITEKLLSDIRVIVERHIKNTYLRQVQAPIGVKPVLKCWMELN